MKTFAKRVTIYLSLFTLCLPLFSGLLSFAAPATASAIPNCQLPFVINPDTGTCWNPSAPPAQPPDDPFYSLSVPDQAAVWTELAALNTTECAPANSGRGSTNGNGVDTTKPSTWYSGTANVGTHVDSKDGSLTCNDESGWITNLLNVAGVQAGSYSTAYKFRPQDLYTELVKKIFPAGMPSTIPPQLKYWILFQAFISTSQSTSCDGHTDPGTPDGRLQYTEGPVDLWVAQGGSVASQPYYYNHPDDTTQVGFNVQTNGSTYACKTIAKLLSTQMSLATAFANNDATDNPAIPGGTSESSADTGCDLNGDPFTWFVCPVIDSLEHMIQKVDNFITESLTFNTKDFFDNPTHGYQKAWNSFRVLATGLLVIGGLVMIASQALGLEILDAYTIKKVLPRLLVAIIGITLSWPLMRYAIDFFNVLGNDVRNLIYSPFGNLSGNIGAGAAGVLAGGGVIGLFTLGPLGILSFLATAALAVLVGFIIIMVRYLALIVLIIFSPIAIAAYILPNTQKLWNLWKDNFLGLLLVFPIISAFIAIGKVFSAVSLDPSQPHAFGGQTIMQLVGLAAYFLPYFLLPIAFRLATGAIGAIAGFVNDRHKGAFDGLKNFRGNRRKSNTLAMKEGRRFNPNARGPLGKVYKGLNSGLSYGTAPGSSAKILAGNLLRKGGFNTSMGMGEINQVDRAKFMHSQKASEVLAGTFNDRSLRALMGMKDHSTAAIRKKATELQASKDIHDRTAGDQLAANATWLSTDLWKDPEMGRTNLQAAAGMALGSHGFAEADDIAQLGNDLGGTENGLANLVTGQAIMNSIRAGRGDFKPGYVIRRNGQGKWESLSADTRADYSRKAGTVMENGVEVDNVRPLQDAGQRERARVAQIQRIKGMNAQDWDGKAQTLDALMPGATEVLSTPIGTYDYTDEAGYSQKYDITESDQSRVLDIFAQATGPYSRLSPDHITKIRKIVEDAGLTPDLEARRRAIVHIPGSEDPASTQETHNDGGGQP